MIGLQSKFDLYSVVENKAEVEMRECCYPVVGIVDSGVPHDR